jgi:AcrR family transcriptional regulator
MVTPTTAPRRAAPLPPEERRRAIVDATLPLLAERGTAVTTRDLAGAAKVSEGTLFNVFADKDELIDAVIAAATDQAPIERAIASIDRSLPFEAQLVAATELLVRRTSEIWRLLSKLVDHHRHASRSRLPEIAALTDLMAAHASRLDAGPDEAARILRSLTLALTHPMFCTEPATAEVIVDRFLHGCGTRTGRGGAT